MARGGRYPGRARARRPARQRPRRPHGALPAARPARRACAATSARRFSTAPSSRRRSGSAATSGTSRSTAARSGREGEFRIDAKVADLALRLRPGRGGRAAARSMRRNPQWPALTAVSGELIIDRTRLEIRDARAQLGGADWTRVRGTIPQLGDHARFEIEGTARGPLAEMLRYVNATPIGRWTGAALAGASGSGTADLKLALSVPLDDPSDTRVKGSLVLAGNDVRMTPDTPLLGTAPGRGSTSPTTASRSPRGSARVLGGDMSFDGGSQGDGSSASPARAWSPPRRCATPPSSARSRACRSLSGQTGYRATLAFVGGPPQIGVTSNLVGLGIDLPHAARQGGAGDAAACVSRAARRTAPLRRAAVRESAAARARPRRCRRTSCASGGGDAAQRVRGSDPPARADGARHGAGRVRRAPGPAGRGRDRARGPEEGRRRRMGSCRRAPARRAGTRRRRGVGARRRRPQRRLRAGPDRLAPAAS